MLTRNGDIKSSTLVAYCREIATEDAEEGEYRPHTHTLWMAADRIEDLIECIKNESVAERLRTLADIIELREEKDAELSKQEG